VGEVDDGGDGRDEGDDVRKSEVIEAAFHRQRKKSAPYLST
jgi:hypothetical protein